MQNYIEKMNLSKSNIGEIVSINEDLFILYENIFINLESKKITNSLKRYSVIEKFLVYFETKNQFRHRIDLLIEEENYVILFQIPPYFSETENITIEYDEKIKEMYILLSENNYYYKIYSFMLSEYEIFKNKDFHHLYDYTEGNYFFEKTGYELSFFKGKKIKKLGGN